MNEIILNDRGNYSTFSEQIKNFHKLFTKFLIFFQKAIDKTG